MKPLLVRAAFAALCGVALSGCIDSSGPILADAQPVLGPRLNLQLYSLREGHAHDPEQASFTWDGKLYVRSGGGMKDVRGFSVHPFEAGDTIIQSSQLRHPQIAEYALMRKLAEGAYQVIAIDEDDAGTDIALAVPGETRPLRVMRMALAQRIELQIETWPQYRLRIRQDLT